MNSDLLTKIKEMMPSFSKGQRLIAKFILEQYDKAAFMTAFKLGSSVGVSESTVVRFAVELGYEGYPQLQKALQEFIRNKLTTIQRMEIATNRIGNAHVLNSVMMSDIEKIRITLEAQDKDTFEATVDRLLSARSIYILGIRSSYALASFLSFYFGLIFENAHLVNVSSVSEMFEQIMRIGKDDVIIGISFPRYSKRTTRALSFAKDRGASVVALTDSRLSPLAKYADHLLIARSEMASFVDSLVAPLSLINALIVAVSMKRRDEVSRIFGELERIWEEYEVYEKDENG